MKVHIDIGPVYFSWVPWIRYRKHLWKFKYGDPVHELAPSVRVQWLGKEISITFGDDTYWQERLNKRWLAT